MTSDGYVLGINWWFHDAAAALVSPVGEVHWVGEEERHTRHRHSWGEFPVGSVAAALAHSGLQPEDISDVMVGWQPWLVHEAAGERWPYSVDDPDRIVQDALGWAGLPRQCGLDFRDHHDAHAASGFYASPFTEAAVLVVDGHGERASVTIYSASRDTGLVQVERYPRPFSLGYFYEAATRHLGFQLLHSGKTMGLASYLTGAAPTLFEFGDGVPPGATTLREDCTWDEGALAWSKWFTERYGVIDRPLESLAADDRAVRLAAEVQATIQSALRYLVERARRLTGQEAICLAGGVAQNCVGAGLITEPVYVPPFPHDAGVALGAAWLRTGASPYPDGISPFLGAPADRRVPAHTGGWATRPYHPDAVAELLGRDEVGALFVGRAEVGARALGHRSIIARPHDPAIRDRLNRMKGREPWRPLAPAGRPECDGRFWQRQGLRARYMAGSALMSGAGRDQLAGACHVDGSCRMQITRTGEALDDILDRLARRGLPPVLINTSFNDRGDPIVHSAQDVVSAARRMRLDFVVWEDVLMTREGPR